MYDRGGGRRGSRERGGAQAHLGVAPHGGGGGSSPRGSMPPTSSTPTLQQKKVMLGYRSPPQQVSGAHGAPSTVYQVPPSATVTVPSPPPSPVRVAVPRDVARGNSAGMTPPGASSLEPSAGTALAPHKALLVSRSGTAMVRVAAEEDSPDHGSLVFVSKTNEFAHLSASGGIIKWKKMIISVDSVDHFLVGVFDRNHWTYYSDTRERYVSILSDICKLWKNAFHDAISVGVKYGKSCYDDKNHDWTQEVFAARTCGGLGKFMSSSRSNVFTAFGHSGYVGVGIECKRDLPARSFDSPAAIINFVEFRMYNHTSSQSVLPIDHMQDLQRYKSTVLSPIPMRTLKPNSWTCSQIASCPLPVCMPKQVEERSGAVMQQSYVHNVKSFVSENQCANLTQAPEGLPVTNVFVCVPDYTISMSPNPDTTTVSELVQAALRKRQIRPQDFFFTRDGTRLTGEEVLSSLPLLRDSRILVNQRSRGGAPFPLHNPVALMCESLDNVLMNNTGRIFDTVVLTPELSTPGKEYSTVYFLGTFTRYLIHKLFIFVLRDGHHRQKMCWRGVFGIHNILYSTDGEVIIDFRVPFAQYSPQGGAADRRQLRAIIDTYLHPPSGLERAVHVQPLLELLENDDERLWADKNFITFVINHPCLLSFADKHKWYNLIDQMVRRLTPAELQALRAIFHDTLFVGWEKYVQSVPGMNHTYMYNAIYDQASGCKVSRYTYHLDQAFHLGWNFLKHPPPGVSLKVAEAALSYLMEYLLAWFVLGLVVNFTGPPGWDVLSVVSNSNSDKSAL